VCKELIENSQPFEKKFQKTAGGGIFLTHTVHSTTETGVLQLQVRSCGTAFQLICDKLTLAFNNLSGF